MNRRDLLRAAAAAGLVVPAERFVRKFFPVGIELRKPRFEATRITVSSMYGDGQLYASSNAGWAVPVVEGDVLTVSFDTSGLSMGSHTALVTIGQSGMSNTIVPVHLSVETRKRPKPLLSLS